MIIQMIAGEIGEHTDHHVHAGQASLIQCMAGGFHAHMAYALSMETGQPGLHVHRIGRGVGRRLQFSIEPVTEGTQHATGFAQLQECLGRNEAAGSLAIGAGERHHLLPR